MIDERSEDEHCDVDEFECPECSEVVEISDCYCPFCGNYLLGQGEI